MPTSFGPQLIGETEKTLNAILQRALHGTHLTEPAWVTLRLAGQIQGEDGADALVLAVTDRAHLTDAGNLVRDLTERELLEGGRLTAAGRHLVESVQAEIAEMTAPIWHDLPPDDVTATVRLLDEVITRARHVLDARR